MKAILIRLPLFITLAALLVLAALAGCARSNNFTDAEKCKRLGYKYWMTERGGVFCFRNSEDGYVYANPASLREDKR